MQKKIIRLSYKENVAATKAANSDPDSKPLTENQWIKVKSSLTRGRGRLASIHPGGIKNESIQI
jgi:hypothetical protein